MKLNLGCGRDIRKGWINCDRVDGPGVDLVFDASKPFPLPSNKFTDVLASHVLEHIPNYADTVLECHRVLRRAGILEVRTPFGMNDDAYHVRYLWPGSLTTFCQPNDGAGSLELTQKRQLFKCLSTRTRRSFWFSYHLKHYLGVKFLEGVRWEFPIGKRVEIIWRLQKL